LIIISGFNCTRNSSCIGHGLHWNCLPKHVIEGKTGGRIEVTEDEEGELSSYWMILRKEDNDNVKIKQ
jgi:hypothetical protein